MDDDKTFDQFVMILSALAFVLFVAWVGTWVYDWIQAADWPDLIREATPPSWR